MNSGDPDPSLPGAGVVEDREIKARSSQYYYYLLDEYLK
jgi:hypothetical protein